MPIWKKIIHKKIIEKYGELGKGMIYLSIFFFLI